MALGLAPSSSAREGAWTHENRCPWTLLLQLRLLRAWVAPGTLVAPGTFAASPRYLTHLAPTRVPRQLQRKRGGPSWVLSPRNLLPGKSGSASWRDAGRPRRPWSHPRGISVPWPSQPPVAAAWFQIHCGWNLPSYRQGSEHFPVIREMTMVLAREGDDRQHRQYGAQRPEASG